MIKIALTHKYAKHIGLGVLVLVSVELKCVETVLIQKKIIPN